jgi:hemerythrin
MSVEWKDSYKIGDPEVDAQHQHLFELINELAAVDSMHDLRPLVMQIYKATREHFELEEALMRRVNYPDIDAHIAHHAKLLGRLNLLSMDVGKGHMSRPAISSLMNEWALCHVTEDDALLSRYLASSPDK